jgi:8-oxo-dGTP pyrophosphatase MutT (NUDIX family)
MQPWKTRSRTPVLDRGKWLQVEDHTVELPDGRTIEGWPWVIIPDYINVVAVTPEGKFVCFRQVKYAVAETSLSVVGGYIEPGEPPLDAAIRELREEAGYVSENWISLGSYAVDANRGCGTANFFLALDATYAGHITSDDLEEQELLLLTESELDDAIANGEFKILAWAAIVAMAKVWLVKKKQ